MVHELDGNSLSVHCIKDAWAEILICLVCAQKCVTIILQYSLVVCYCTLLLLCSELLGSLIFNKINVDATRDTLSLCIYDAIKGNESHVGNIQFWFFNINFLSI